MKLKVRKFSEKRESELRQRGWQEDFVEDLIRNQGRAFTPTSFKHSELDGTMHMIMQTEPDGCIWHNGGYWNFGDDYSVFNEIFYDVEKEERFPEELFTI